MLSLSKHLGKFVEIILIKMTESEKKQLTKGLFITTGAVLGATLYAVDRLTGGILFAILSAGIFFLAANVRVNKIIAYVGALIIWFGMYKVFQAF